MSRARAIVQSYVGVVVFAMPLFLAAGRLVWPPGLAYLTLALVGTTLNHLLVPPGSDLTERRVADARAGEAWDRRLLGLGFLVSVVTFVVAGLDARFGWSGSVPGVAAAAGGVAMFAGQALFASAKRENTWFSSTVRVQEEHGHRVCDTGPYRWVRHPGYLGLFAAQLGFPLVVHSWVAFVPTLVGLGVLVARTRREDTFLAEHLDGYAAFRTRTRARLFPGVW